MPPPSPGGYSRTGRARGGGGARRWGIRRSGAELTAPKSTASHEETIPEIRVVDRHPGPAPAREAEFDRHLLPVGTERAERRRRDRDHLAPDPVAFNNRDPRHAPSRLRPSRGPRRRSVPGSRPSGRPCRSTHRPRGGLSVRSGSTGRRTARHPRGRAGRYPPDEWDAVALVDELPAGRAAGHCRAGLHGVCVECSGKAGRAARVDRRSGLADVVDVVDKADTEVPEEPERLHLADPGREVRARGLDVIDMDLENGFVCRVEHEGYMLVESREDRTSPLRCPGKPDEQGAVVEPDTVGMDRDLVRAREQALGNNRVIKAIIIGDIVCA